MSRVAVTLDAHALTELRLRAQTAGEPVSRTAARMVRDALLATGRREHREHAEAAKTGERQGADRPPWIEPLSDQQAWRRELWAAVTALAARYPRQLADLPAGWWQDRAHTETLAAICHWRAQLDGQPDSDPRTELLFHDRLDLLRRQLTEQVQPTAARFTGGAPPSAWLA